jgi:hypothetical protein
MFLLWACELYQHAQSLAEQIRLGIRRSRRWTPDWLVSAEKIDGDKVTLYVHPDSRLPMRAPDEDGRPRHWILEIHSVDQERQIGGFYEELPTVSVGRHRGATPRWMPRN